MCPISRNHVHFNVFYLLLFSAHHMVSVCTQYGVGCRLVEFDVSFLCHHEYFIPPRRFHPKWKLKHRQQQVQQQNQQPPLRKHVADHHPASKRWDLCWAVPFSFHGPPRHIKYTNKKYPCCQEKKKEANRLNQEIVKRHIMIKETSVNTHIIEQEKSRRSW